jgi:bifunctional non-homologous end joining protein LigD
LVALAVKGGDLVSKHCERTYGAGRCTHWLKVKNPKHPAHRRVQDQF